MKPPTPTPRDRSRSAQAKQQTIMRKQQRRLTGKEQPR